MSSGLRFSGAVSRLQGGRREDWDHGCADHSLMYCEAVDCFEWAVSRPAEHPPGLPSQHVEDALDPLRTGEAP